jgi:repeat uncharacterized protein DUF346
MVSMRGILTLIASGGLMVAFPQVLGSSDRTRPPTLAEAVEIARAEGFTSDPTAVSWGANRIDVFARGPDNALWHKSWDGNIWSGWESLGGSLASGPDVASWGSGRLDVFARGTDNTLQHMSYQNGWSAWESLGGALTSDPSAVAWGPGRLDVFARGGDDALWHLAYGGTWSGWESLGGSIASGPDVSSWGAGRLDIFARGKDNTLQHKSYENGWSPWESLKGNLTSDPSAVSWSSSRIDVFARGPDNALWHLAYAGSWSSWESLGGVLGSGPDASSWGLGRLDVFAQGTDHNLYHMWYSSGWSAWESQGAPVQTNTNTSDVTLVATAAGRAPTGLAVTGLGVTATVSWQAFVDDVSYVVTRWLQSDLNCCKASSPTLTTARWTDTGLQWPGTYVYRVAVTYSDGKVGSADYTFTRPTPQDPTGFTAVQIGEGQVKLTWQPVTGVTTYLVGGPGTGFQGTQVSGNSVTLNSVPPGTHQWTVASLYSPGGLLTPAASWPKTSLTIPSLRNTYRIVLEGFRVGKPTPEDPLIADGRGDEIYIVTRWNLYDVNGLLRNTGLVTTGVFGDTHNFPNRTQAGSASPSGGLIEYDTYPRTPPLADASITSGLRFTIWEGELSDAGEWIAFSPAIWEQDGNDRVYRTFASYYQMMAVSLYRSERLRIGRDSGIWEMITTCGGDDNSSNSPWIPPGGIGPADIPVNIDPYRNTWCPSWVTLNRRTFNTLLQPGQHMYEVAPGLFLMKYWTDASEYRLFIRLEKLR